MAAPKKPHYPKRVNRNIARIDFNTGDMDNLIEDQGCRVRITPAVVCPRRTSKGQTEESDHDLNCPLCGGSMVVEVPSLSKDCWAFIQGIKFDETFAPQGLYDVKDAQITLPLSVRVAYWFKVEVLDFGSLFNQLVSRNISGVVDTLRYQTFETWDGNFYYAVDNDGKVFTRKTDDNPDGDFTVALDKLTWVGARKPDSGKMYSLIYPMLPTFRVLELIHANRYYYKDFRQPDKEPIELPQQAQIRWDYLARGGGFDVLRSK